MVGASLLAGCKNPGDPFGVLDAVTVRADVVRLVGWAVDTSDADEFVEIHVYVDGRGRGAFVADRPRPDVTDVWGETFPDMGTRHGFDISVTVGEPGAHEVCAYGINVGAGKENTLLGCRTAITLGYSPWGTVDQLLNLGTTMRVVGWAFDPESPEPIRVRASTPRGVVGTFTADRARPDVQSAFPGQGPDHGFSFDLPGNLLTQGERLCLDALNVGPRGTTTRIGCRQKSVEVRIVNTIVISVTIADQLQGLVNRGRQQGLNLTGQGYRTPEEQIAERIRNCGPTYYDIYEKPTASCDPPTAIPGRSMHERGLAIDFRCNGEEMLTRASPCFPFLAANASDFGLFNLPSEPWHWSTNGN